MDLADSATARASYQRVSGCSKKRVRRTTSATKIRAAAASSAIGNAGELRRANVNEPTEGVTGQKSPASVPSDKRISSAASRRKKRRCAWIEAPSASRKIAGISASVSWSGDGDDCIQAPLLTS